MQGYSKEMWDRMSELNAQKEMKITVSYWESDEYMEQKMGLKKEMLDKYLQGFDKYLVGNFEGKLVAIRTDFIVWLRED